MALELVEVAAPRVQAVAADEQAVRVGLSAQQRFHGGGGRRPVLRVLDDGQPLAVGVRGHPAEPLEHLVPLDGEAALRRRPLREERAPDGMGMGDGARPARADDGQVQARLRGGTAGPAGGAPLVIDGDHLRALDRALVRPAGSDDQAQGVGADHGAEVPARPEGPAALVGAAHDAGQALRGVARRLLEGGHGVSHSRKRPAKSQSVSRGGSAGAGHGRPPRPRASSPRSPRGWFRPRWPPAARSSPR